MSGLRLSLVLVCLAALAPWAAAIRDRVVEDSSKSVAEEDGAQAAARAESDVDSSKCNYKTPSEAADANEGYAGMDRLTSEMDVGFYAYGPMFKGKGQIAAWKYNPSTQFVEFWWSKSHCMLMCKDCCNKRGSNEPGVLSVPMNPSATTSWLKYKLTKNFREGEDIQTQFSTLRVSCSGGSCVFKDKSNGCTLDHIYVCGKTEFVVRYRDC